MAMALFSGFIVDNFTLKRIDLLFENIVLFFYLVLSCLAIVFINLYESKRLKNKILNWIGLLAPVGLQYALGGLYSAFFIFYFRSASVGTSWPFLLFLLMILIGNDVFAKKLHKLPVQIGVFFVALFSFSIFYAPVLIGKIGNEIFLLSGGLSLILILLFVWLLSKIDLNLFLENRKKIIITISSLFLLINVAYFTNIIPPIPISLKNIQVAYETNRTSEGYRVVTASRHWYQKIFSYQDFKIIKDQPVYIYSAIFAPTKLQTNVLHQWQFKNKYGKWENRSEVTFPITGGRDGGYRGYTILWNMEEGLWRVNIKTKTSQIIGRIKFNIEYVEEIPETTVDVY